MWLFDGSCTATLSAIWRFMYRHLNSYLTVQLFLWGRAFCIMWLTLRHKIHNKQRSFSLSPVFPDYKHIIAIRIMFRWMFLGQINVVYILYIDIQTLSGPRSVTILFLAALQPYKSSCPRKRWWCKNIFQIFRLVIKTKLVQNVNRMSERQTRRLSSFVNKTKIVQNVNRRQTIRFLTVWPVWTILFTIP